MSRPLRGLLIACALLLASCGGTPDGVTPVSGFALDRYLGEWHEIARLDHRFERGLEQVSATYTRNADGSVRVVNRGLDPAQNRWREAVGRAVLAGPPDRGQLLVSFFWPFRSSYNIFILDPDYRYAVVSGPSHDYLWILARNPSLPRATYDQLVAQARAAGFAVDQLIRVNQMAEPRPAPRPVPTEP